MNTFDPKTSYLRVATATPRVHVGNCQKNTKEIRVLYKKAVKQNVSLVVFPELSITGYTAGDLLLTTALQNDALKEISQLCRLTRNTQTGIIVGAPLRYRNALYNCAVFISHGVVQGIVPKINLPNYKEFYEKRWFQSGEGISSDIILGSQKIPFGSDLLFDVAGALIGIEICEDVWVNDQPSRKLSARGAIIICNPSASPEMATKSNYRRTLISHTSAAEVGAYIYAGADPSESTMDIVMGGHSMICQLGRILAERPAFSTDQRLLMADIDCESILNERMHDNNFTNVEGARIISTSIARTQKYLHADFDATPFIPKGSDETVNERLDEILTIQSYGLKKRLESSRAERVVLGLSGGLDSTLALLVALRTAQLNGQIPHNSILALIMPGHASTNRTQSNAEKLAIALGIQYKIIPISKMADDQLHAMGRDPLMQDITYENTQARMRTALLFNSANAHNGIVLGTGDLSEIALGWCTFNGDHMSAYNVNASIPKTLVKSLVERAAGSLSSRKARRVLRDILDTPISPELTRSDDETISQKTEDIIGPYVLHDFFLYHFIRWSCRPEKLHYIALKTFKGTYSEHEISKWLNLFFQRFVANQWKRSVMADGPKVGSVSLSPRGDWRMPSDADPGAFHSLLV